ncbi:MAG: hypothetical protein ABIJ56_19950 [Pseudomonadota bacterium]|nr:hypothetical protein [Actinomycetota bacterium]
MHDIQRGQLDFIGKISASVSHEINNVLSVINENSGLLSDLLILAGRGGDLDPDKLRRVNGTIQKNLQRGKAIIKRLNRFAHSLEGPAGRINAGEDVENIVELTRRIAYQSKVELEMDPPQEPVEIETRSLPFKQAVFQGIMIVLRWSESGDRINVVLRERESGAEITIEGQRPAGMDDADDEGAFLSLLMEEMKGKAIFDPGKGAIRLHLPRSGSGG